MGMPLRRQFETIKHRIGRMVAAHRIHRQGESPLVAWRGKNSAGSGHVSHDQAPPSWTKTVASRLVSEADGAAGLLGGHDFATVVMPAMRADMVRALQLAAIRAFLMRRGAQRFVASTHPAAGGRNFLFRDGHGAEPFRSMDCQVR